MLDYRDKCPYCGRYTCKKARVCEVTGRRFDYWGITQSEGVAGVAFLVTLFFAQDLMTALVVAAAAYFLSKTDFVKNVFSVFGILAFFWIMGSAFGLIDWNPFTALLANQ